MEKRQPCPVCLTDLKKKDLHSSDWFFVGNAITPMIASAGGVGAAAQLHAAVTASLVPDRLLTVAENTSTEDFESFCAELKHAHLYDMDKSGAHCEGDWLAHCNFYVTGSRRPTRPPLRMATCTAHWKQGEK